MFDALMSSYDLGGLTLKNRVVFAPTSWGLPQDDEVKRLGRIAAGGCALVVVGDVPVGHHGPSSLFTRKGMEHYKRVVSAIHEGGALAAAQLHESDTDIKALLALLPGMATGLVSPDTARAKINAQAGPYISKMPAKKVQSIIDSFGAAAIRAYEAGFDVIQVHGDRMCGSFSSALMNTRTDEFGGTLAGRMRFALGAVRAVRSALPQIPIDYKLAVRKIEPAYGRAGIAEDELVEAVPMLVEAGVTSFHVTLANHGSLSDTIPPRNHPDFGAEGCFLPFCDQVRRYAPTLPLTGVGGLTNPAFINEQIASGRIELAGMCRQLIADPDWPTKVAQGDVAAIRRCVRCNKDCLGGIQRREGTHCIYDAKNPGGSSK